MNAPKGTHSLKIERNFSHPPAHVWEFVTKSENLMKWWGPEGTTLGDCDLEFTRLGAWFFTLIDPQGTHHRVTGEVLKVNPPEFVEFTLIAPNPDGSVMIDSLVQFHIANDNQGGTNFTLIQTGLSHDQMVKGSTQGWVSTLGRLERLIDQV